MGSWSTKKKRGRPKVATQKWDYGNAVVQARAALFRHFRGESSQGFEMSCAGRLMLVGAFDGLDHAPETCLASLLEYSNGYWGHFGGGPKVAAYERQDRSNDGGDYNTPDPRGDYFARIDQRLRDAGYHARRAVHEVTVDRHWFPDEDVSWAARIINSRIVQKRIAMRQAGEPIPDELCVAGELAADSDFAMLDLLRHGAMALAGGELRRAA